MVVLINIKNVYVGGTAQKYHICKANLTFNLENKSDGLLFFYLDVIQLLRNMKEKSESVIMEMKEGTCNQI